MGGACPFKVAQLVLPLCMDVWRSKTLRGAAAQAGLIVGFGEWQEGTGPNGAWQVSKQEDVKFSKWLGCTASSLPFTNAALLFLWYYERVCSLS
jgi:hypothetical protein